MHGVTTIVFDLDNTLIDRDGAVRAWLATMLTPTQVDACLRLDASGYGDRTAFFVAVAAASARPQARIRASFREEVPHFIRPIAGAATMLARVRPYYRLAIASNGNTGMQQAKLAAAQLGVPFDLVVISEAIGVEKPAAAFFTHVLNALQCPAAKALMVGDHPENDIVGAASVGMRTCWLRTAQFTPPRADAAIDSLDQLLYA